MTEFPVHDSFENQFEHVFRHESGRLVSMLTRVFGPAHMERAEDVVQESFIEALELWQMKGIPDNPAAWIYRVAKNKALNLARRDAVLTKNEGQLAERLYEEDNEVQNLERQLDSSGVVDDQLRMMFVCSHPSLSKDSQIALALKTLCGFSISEIARAFMTGEENIHKRLVRARQSLRDAHVSFDLPQGSALRKGLQAVLETIYLLFNEGYSASKGEDVIRFELCDEALRLANLLLAVPVLPDVESIHALLALMLINASRFRARHDAEGNLLALHEQDRSLWEPSLFSLGLQHLVQASQRDAVSIYHLLAAISAEYSMAASMKETQWDRIVQWYDDLYALDPSPLIRLNQAVALSYAKSPQFALVELQKLASLNTFEEYHLYHTTIADVAERCAMIDVARTHYTRALSLTVIRREQDLIKRKLRALEGKSDIV